MFRLAVCRIVPQHAHMWTLKAQPPACLDLADDDMSPCEALKPKPRLSPVVFESLSKCLFEAGQAPSREQILCLCDQALLGFFVGSRYGEVLECWL